MSARSLIGISRMMFLCRIIITIIAYNFILNLIVNAKIKNLIKTQTVYFLDKRLVEVF